MRTNIEAEVIEMDEQEIQEQRRRIEEEGGAA